MSYYKEMMRSVHGRSRPAHRAGTNWLLPRRSNSRAAMLRNRTYRMSFLHASMIVVLLGTYGCKRLSAEHSGGSYDRSTVEAAIAKYSSAVAARDTDALRDAWTEGSFVVTMRWPNHWELAEKQVACAQAVVQNTLNAGTTNGVTIVIGSYGPEDVRALTVKLGGFIYCDKVLGSPSYKRYGKERLEACVRSVSLSSLDTRSLDSWFTYSDLERAARGLPKCDFKP